MQTSLFVMMLTPADPRALGF